VKFKESDYNIKNEPDMNKNRHVSDLPRGFWFLTGNHIFAALFQKNSKLCMQ